MQWSDWYHRHLSFQQKKKKSGISLNISRVCHRNAGEKLIWLITKGPYLTPSASGFDAVIKIWEQGYYTSHILKWNTWTLLSFSGGLNAYWNELSWYWIWGRHRYFFFYLRIMKMKWSKTANICSCFSKHKYISWTFCRYFTGDPKNEYKI